MYIVYPDTHTVLHMETLIHSQIPKNMYLDTHILRFMHTDTKNYPGFMASSTMIIYVCTYIYIDLHTSHTDTRTIPRFYPPLHTLRTLKHTIMLTYTSVLHTRYTHTHSTYALMHVHTIMHRLQI